METGHPSTRAVNSGSGNRAYVSTRFRRRFAALKQRVFGVRGRSADDDVTESDGTPSSAATAGDSGLGFSEPRCVLVNGLVVY